MAQTTHTLRRTCTAPARTAEPLPLPHPHLHSHLYPHSSGPPLLTGSRPTDPWLALSGSHISPPPLPSHCGPYLSTVTTPAPPPAAPPRSPDHSAPPTWHPRPALLPSDPAPLPGTGPAHHSTRMHLHAQRTCTGPGSPPAVPTSTLPPPPRYASASDPQRPTHHHACTTTSPNGDQRLGFRAILPRHIRPAHGPTTPRPTRITGTPSGYLHRQRPIADGPDQLALP